MHTVPTWLRHSNGNLLTLRSSVSVATTCAPLGWRLWWILPQSPGWDCSRHEINSAHSSGHTANWSLYSARTRQTCSFPLTSQSSICASPKLLSRLECQYFITLAHKSGPGVNGGCIRLPNE